MTAWDGGLIMIIDMVIPPNQTDIIFNNADFGQRIRSTLSLEERPTSLQMKQVKDFFTCYLIALFGLQPFDIFSYSHEIDSVWMAARTMNYMILTSDTYVSTVTSSRQNLINMVCCVGPDFVYEQCEFLTLPICLAFWYASSPISKFESSEKLFVIFESR